MSAAYDIISRDNDLKPYLSKTGTDQDDFLDMLITMISSGIESFIGGPAVEQTYTDEIVDGNGKNFLLLRHAPITSLKTPAVADVQYRTSPDQAWQNLESDVRFILIKPDNPFALFLDRDIFPHGNSNIKLCYKAGYTAGADMEVLRYVCLQACAEEYKNSNKGDGRLGRSSISISSGGVSGTDSFFSLSDRHKKILSRYRKVGF